MFVAGGAAPANLCPSRSHFHAELRIAAIGAGGKAAGDINAALGEHLVAVAEQV